MTRTKCAWCGAPVVHKQTRCDKCATMLRHYKAYCRDIHKGSDMSMLLEFRNLILDLKYNMPGAELLPKDLDYQFDRVNSYIAREVD